MSAPILVVDDSKVNRMVASSKLREADFPVKIVEDGAAAIAFLRLDEPASEPPARAVLLDVMMPGVDGMEVLRAIRKRWDAIQLPVIMATAKDGQEDILQALEEGANDYITKPLDLPVLLARVSAHLRLQDSHAALRDAQKALMSSARMDAIAILASGIAKRLRQPLGQIQRALNGIEDLTANLSEETRNTGADILAGGRNAVRDADTIVDDLIKASEDDKLKLSLAKLPEIVSESVTVLEDESMTAGVEISLNVDAPLPEVLVSKEEFQQALAEIIRNGTQAMADLDSASEIPLTITIAKQVLGDDFDEPTADNACQLKPGDTAVTVTVIDNGPGMSETDLGKAFDPFYTVNSRNGLGLTIARNILHLHGGAIQLHNRDDGNSGLRVTLFLRSADTVES